LDFEVQFPVAAGTLNRYAWLVAQEFAQLLMIPLKKKISAERLEAIELRVSDEALQLVEKVKAAFVTVQADQQLVSRLRVIQETNAASLGLAQKQFEAGNITDLALLQSQASYSQGRLDLAKAEADLRDKREELTRLLGLWGVETAWRVQGDIMPIPDSDFSQKGLESLAVSQRLDLRAAHRELTSVAAALGLSRIYRWIPVLEFGFTGERDIEGALNMGPAFRLELPIFNQGQARLARGAAELRRAENRLAGLAITIRSETRELRDRLASLRDMARFYHDEVLPTRIKIVNRTLLQYNAMQVSPTSFSSRNRRNLRPSAAISTPCVITGSPGQNSSALSEESFPPPTFLPARTEKPPRKNHEESTRFHAPRLCRPNRLLGRGCRLAASPQSAERRATAGRRRPFRPDGSTGVDKAAAIPGRAWAGLSAGDHPQRFFAAISRG
jgi:hypothetical protein